MSKWLTSEFPFMVGYYGYLTMPIVTLLGILYTYRFTKQGLFLVAIFSSFTLLSQILNGILKKIFMQPRPKDQINITKHDEATHPNMGMPSGHSQSVAISLMFLYKTVPSQIFRIVGTVITLLTLLQRYVYRKHTLAQVVTGCLIGLLLGYIGYETYIWVKTKKIEITRPIINIGFVLGIGLLVLCLLIDKSHIIEKMRKI